jgi:excisionase family DNA binding protein
VQRQIESRPDPTERQIVSDHTCQLLDLPQAAQCLGTSERHLRRLWQERRISAIKVGRRVRFAKADLAEFVASHRVKAVR